jgi:hypothetical protein
MQPLDVVEAPTAAEETIDDVLQRRGFVDCDVHAVISDGGRGIYPYMSKAWQQRFDEKGFSVAVGAAMRFRPMFSVERPDAGPPRVAGPAPIRIGSSRTIWIDRTSAVLCCSISSRRLFAVLASLRMTAWSPRRRRTTTSSSSGCPQTRASAWR